MRLESILEVLSENKSVNVWDEGEVIARYDGRDSIPAELNDRLVNMVDCEENTFNVYLECEW